MKSFVEFLVEGLVERVADNLHQDIFICLQHFGSWNRHVNQ